MKHGFIRGAAVFTFAAAVAGAALQAQAPAQQPAQGNAGQQAQAARAALANQPAPRRADGRVILGNTTTLKCVWIGGGLGFCNSNRVEAPPSLNPGSTGGPGGVGLGPAGAAGGLGGGAGRGGG